jgi:hypothetical protein
LKLSTIAVKAIAKPLASRLKIEAAVRPRLREVCESIGNGVHYFYSRINVMATGHKFIGVKPLAPETALADGISTLSESLVLGFSAAVIIVDFQRSAASNEAKAAKAAAEKRAEFERLESRFLALEARTLAMERRAESRWFNLESEKAREEREAAAAAAGGKSGRGWLSGWFS